MAQVTYLGAEGESDVCGDFKKGEAVEINDPVALAAYHNNRFFKVEGYKKPKEDDPLTFRAPSAVPVAGAVPKAGEPVPTDILPEEPISEPPPDPEEPPVEIPPPESRKVTSSVTRGRR